LKYSATSYIPTFSGGACTLTTDSLSQATAIYHQFVVRPDAGFTASFTLTVSGSKVADGCAFVVREIGSGTLGSTGGACGYEGISGKSLAVILKIYQSSNVFLGLNGSAQQQTPTSPVVLASGNSISVTVVYNATAQTLAVTLNELAAGRSMTKTFTGVTISGLCYAGFTGGTGGSTAVQTISNFSMR
jgi:hypothetical protein